MRLAMILFALLVVSPPSAAEDAPPPLAPPAKLNVDGAGEIDEWHRMLVEARERLEKAHGRFAAARYSYRDARQRKRRGTEKAGLLAELEAAELELAEAQAELPVLLEKARRAGVPPGVLREFDD